MILLHTLISLILKVYILQLSSVKFSCKFTFILYETIRDYASLSLPFYASFMKHFHIILYTLYQLRFSQNLHILNTNYSDFYHSLICFSSYNDESYRKKEDNILIEVKHLTKKYGTHLAVDDLSFTIEKGRIYGFLGPNGAGKSTTMNIMTGYIGASSGEVIINGHNILEEPEKAKKCIGYLPEIPPLYLDMTVSEYLYFAAELKKIPKADRNAQVIKVMELIKLVDMKDRLIKNLSKGYRQRTGLAAAILDFPDIIILDEPTVGLDPKQIIEIRELIRTLAKDHTVILSSHILAEVQEICDDILIISKGKLIAEGSPDELEELTHGKETIELTILANETSVKQVLSDFSDINDVNWLDVSKDSCHIQINTNKDSQEICADLSLKFAQKKMPVTQMFVNKATLEDIFLELTGDVMEVTNNACYL